MHSLAQIEGVSHSQQCLTSVGALDQIWSLVWGLGDEGRRRSSSASRSTGRLSRRFLHPLHGHKDAGKLLQRHVAKLGGKGAWWILQTHQPTGVACDDRVYETINLFFKILNKNACG